MQIFYVKKLFYRVLYQFSGWQISVFAGIYIVSSIALPIFDTAPCQ